MLRSFKNILIILNLWLLFREHLIVVQKRGGIFVEESLDFVQVERLDI